MFRHSISSATQFRIVIRSEIHVPFASKLTATSEDGRFRLSAYRPIRNFAAQIAEDEYPSKLENTHVRTKCPPKRKTCQKHTPYYSDPPINERGSARGKKAISIFHSTRLIKPEAGPLAHPPIRVPLAPPVSFLGRALHSYTPPLSRKKRTRRDQCA